jgi:hypothetical protein
MLREALSKFGDAKREGAKFEFWPDKQMSRAVENNSYMNYATGAEEFQPLHSAVAPMPFLLSGFKVCV